MKRCNLKNESGAVLIETALIAPVMLLLIFFGVDLLFYSESRTVITQIAREGAIYLATVPGELTTQTPFENVEDDTEWSMICAGDYNAPDCPQVNTQIRVHRMLQGTNKFINADGASIKTQYMVEGGGNFIALTVDVPVQTFFGMFSSSVVKTIKLRRVNS